MISLLVMLIAGCQDGPTAIHMRNYRPGSTDPGVASDPLREAEAKLAAFPDAYLPLKKSGQIYAFSAMPPGQQYDPMTIALTKRSRYVLYDDMTFALQYFDGGDAWTGRWEQADRLVTLHSDVNTTMGPNHPQIPPGALWEPWGATAVVSGDTLAVRYTTTQWLDGFLHASYSRVP